MFVYKSKILPKCLQILLLPTGSLLQDDIEVKFRNSIIHSFDLIFIFLFSAKWMNKKSKCDLVWKENLL
jgi:hypothetical protein